MNTCKFHITADKDHQFIKVGKIFLECGYINSDKIIKFYVKEVTRFTDHIETLLMEIKTDVVLIKQLIRVGIYYTVCTEFPCIKTLVKNKDVTISLKNDNHETLRSARSRHFLNINSNVKK